MPRMPPVFPGYPPMFPVFTGGRRERPRMAFAELLYMPGGMPGGSSGLVRPGVPPKFPKFPGLGLVG